MEYGFSVGDRVQLIIPRGPIPAGRLGTVVRIFAPGFYAVEFDGERIARILTAESLTLVTAQPKREPAA